MYHSVGYAEQQIISCLGNNKEPENNLILWENNSCRQHYLYNCKCFSYENPDLENKVHGKVACGDYIGSMKEAIEVESLTKKK
jgi:hypothetical protein